MTTDSNADVTVKPDMWKALSGGLDDAKMGALLVYAFKQLTQWSDEVGDCRIDVRLQLFPHGGVDFEARHNDEMTMEGYSGSFYSLLTHMFPTAEDHVS